MQRGIDAPPVLQADVSSDGMLIVWLLLALVAVGVAASLAIRSRDPLPVAACVGALICTLNEPIFDVLAQLAYAESPHVAYSAFGRDIPWTVVVGYVPWVGLMPYVISRMMAAGEPRARLLQVSAGLFLSVVLIEVVNAAWLHAWKYYGESAWRGVMGGGIIQMAAMPMLCALLYYVLGENVRGWRRVLMGLTLPAMALPLVFAATTWPLYFSNHTRLPALLDWAAAGVSIALCLAAVLAITRVAARWHAGELALGRADS